MRKLNVDIFIIEKSSSFMESNYIVKMFNNLTNVLAVQISVRYLNNCV